MLRFLRIIWRKCNGFTNNSMLLYSTLFSFFFLSSFDILIIQNYRCYELNKHCLPFNRSLFSNWKVSAYNGHFKMTPIVLDDYTFSYFFHWVLIDLESNWISVVSLLDSDEAVCIRNWRPLCLLDKKKERIDLLVISIPNLEEDLTFDEW